MKLVFIAGLFAFSGLLVGQQSSPATQSQAKSSPGIGAPQLPDLTESTTGYLENPFVGTQLRIRFDAGFEDRTPDRAEFFYGKCGCFRLAGLDPEAPGPGPGIITNLRFQEYAADFEYAVRTRLSGFAEIPLRGIQPIEFAPGTGSFPNHFGLGDIRLGLKYALVPEVEHYISVQFKAYLPSGKADQGLGTHHYSVEPAVLFQKQLSDRAALSGQGGVWIPIHGSTRAPVDNGRYPGEVISYGAGLSYKLSAPDAPLRVTPVIEFLGWNVRGGSVTVPTGIASASNSNIINLKAGARLAFKGKNSIYVGYGRELSDIGWYRDILRTEYRRVF